MGYAAQVHEKTNKQGTCAYHSVDRWYLYTLLNHYRTHAYHVKATRSKRLTDTMELQHKSMTNPTITHADKVMKALEDCAKAIKGVTAGKSSSELRDLQ